MALAAGAAGPARAQRMWGPGAVPLAHYAAPLADWPAPSYRAKDFTLLKVGSVYHLFYTRGQRYVPRHAGTGANQVLNETCFGHAVSRDLENWSELDTVLAIDASSFERHHVWAPTVVQAGGVWWMLYTGVTDSLQTGSTTSWLPRVQVVCAAWSVDPRLMKWTRLPQPVWEPCASDGLPGVPWAVCTPTMTWESADFRDPFVLPPPAGSPAGSPWLLYYTARPQIDPWNYVLGVAQSTPGPNGGWTDLGALWDTYAPALNSKLESPHVFQHGGTWNLFVSGDDGTNGILRYTALWPATGPWESVGSIIPLYDGKPDPPYPFTLDPAWWFASEYFAEDGPVDRAEYFCSLHTYDAPDELNPPGTTSATVDPITDVEFRRMLWNADGSFDLSTPNPVRSLALSRTSAVVGDTLTVTLGVAGGGRQRADFAVVLQTPTGEQAVPAANVGLPASVPLADGTLTVAWPVRGVGLTLPANVVVRMGNQPLRLDTMIQLNPAPGGGDVVSPPMPIVRLRPPGSSGTGGGMALAGAPPATPTLRTVGAAPGRGGTGFLVGLPADGPARLDIYDVRGRRLCTVTSGTLARGWTLLGWDGRDATGRAAGRGLFFARLVTPAGGATARILHID